jgi:hypothetical protein
MTCSTCADRGLVKVNWNDAPEDYAVCLCPAGELLRAVQVKGQQPAWRLEAARRGLDLERVVMLEDVCTPEELAQRGVPGTNSGGCDERDCCGGAASKGDAMSELEVCSVFVARCKAALAECDRLTFLGMSRELAIVQSGLRDAVMGREPVNQGEPLRDVRKMIAGDVE